MGWQRDSHGLLDQNGPFGKGSSLILGRLGDANPIRFSASSQRRLAGIGVEREALAEGRDTRQAALLNRIVFGV